MPSGAKKRKAARRKKEKGVSNPPHGVGDLKVSSQMSGNSDEYHSITEGEIEKKNKNPSSVRSENENVDKVHKSSSSSSSSRSSGTSSGSSSDDESNSIEKNIVMIESNDPIIPQNPSDLPELLLGVEDSAVASAAAAAILEVTVTPSSTVDLVVPPFQDHNSLENEKEKNYADQIDLEEGEVGNNLVTDPSSSTSINQNILVSLVEEEMGEEKYIVLEENTATNTATESKLKIDQSVSNTIETSSREHKGKDYQSTVIAGSVERQQVENSPPKVLQRTSWASCCGLFELFGGSNR
ncbi:myb-like protein X [Impatiens glandulifera]|uniref:myb-like protein X n=1 Tax=Impatiens glandulifera TaxID=253017 RepID=UPI001FB19E11|nr:myb-like protein X [Impatiens glandulifera]